MGERRRSWIKLGCLGVVAVVGLLLLWAASVVGTAVWRGRTEIVETHEVTPALPDGATPVPGRVVLDLMVGEFRVVPGKPGEPLHVSARFDRRSYELRESLEGGPETGWTYRVTFGETMWLKDGGLRGLLGGSFPRITVTLPPDVPLALEGRFGKGPSTIDLGGLWLTRVDLRLDKGAMMLDIDEPLARPVEQFRIRSRQGATFARRLGNASPRLLEIDHGLGALAVELDGNWVRDADVRVRSFLGGGEVHIPDDVNVDGLGLARAGRAAGSPELPLPTLRMSVRARIGELRIVEQGEEFK